MQRNPQLSIIQQQFLAICASKLYVQRENSVALCTTRKDHQLAAKVRRAKITFSFKALTFQTAQSRVIEPWLLSGLLSPLLCAGKTTFSKMEPFLLLLRFFLEKNGDVTKDEMRF